MVVGPIAQLHTSPPASPPPSYHHPPSFPPMRSLSSRFTVSEPFQTLSSRRFQMPRFHASLPTTSGKPPRPSSGYAGCAAGRRRPPSATPRRATPYSVPAAGVGGAGAVPPLAGLATVTAVPAAPAWGAPPPPADSKGARRRVRITEPSKPSKLSWVTGVPTCPSTHRAGRTHQNTRGRIPQDTGADRQGVLLACSVSGRLACWPKRREAERRRDRFIRFAAHAPTRPPLPPFDTAAEVRLPGRRSQNVATLFRIYGVRRAWGGSRAQDAEREVPYRLALPHLALCCVIGPATSSPEQPVTQTCSSGAPHGSLPPAAHRPCCCALSCADCSGTSTRMRRRRGGSACTSACSRFN